MATGESLDLFQISTELEAEAATIEKVGLAINAALDELSEDAADSLADCTPDLDVVLSRISRAYMGEGFIDNNGNALVPTDAQRLCLAAGMNFGLAIAKILPTVEPVPTAEPNPPAAPVS